MSVVIHRNHTFEHAGTRYTCLRLGPYGSGDDAWEVYRTRDGKNVGEFRTLADIRAYVDRSDEPLISD